jgi:hypothetical protein
MVLLGGLEIVAAGYLIHKHKEKKRIRLEEEEEEARRAARHQSRSRSRKSSQHHHTHSAPPRDRKGSRRPSGPPPQYAPQYSHSAESVLKDKAPQPSYPIPQSYIPPNLQPHHTSQYYTPPMSYPPQDGYQTEQAYYGTPHTQPEYQPEYQPQQQYSPIEYPSHLVELSSEPHRRQNFPSSILREPSQERPRRSSESHVRFALPTDGNGSPLEELHASTPPPPYHL